ncbi:MBOAT family O-acyltransferase [Pelolinea submarina]|uniref:Alginate O-acetyltransferase complex protein AlgI n=1 Tax=Pelolinea submarina TaxID=913107 RepID=A0A347ZW08_9CHLR|nr:MBOAT family O-acyltransferase [Pelolinea submarina]REG07185.1 alginate O-acetyltransferase complex protein AlgI [Pelolinea submarina]BBB49489.1 alginate O-acetyltransferase complex protein AlgI [Pelolinea submarina]
MLFPSLVFLFIFFPIVLILYNLNRSAAYRNVILLLASLVFYTWGEPVYVFLLLLLILYNWAAGRWIDKKNAAGGDAGLLTGISIAVNLLPLVLLKAATTAQFNLPLLNALRTQFPNLRFPLGISFFTFSAISYLVDVNRGEIEAETNLLRLANYMAFFPKLLQGPITRFKDMQTDLASPRTNLDDIADGLRRFIIGLTKKVLIADNLAVVADKVFGLQGSDMAAGLAWYGLLAFAVQIYMDFSGYTDMAIGLARMLGFKLPENFNFPYLSRSIADFWRRWHMSLMNFFRTYIFMPLEIARRKLKHFRQQSNLLIVFLVTGFWHGITPNFILWGLYFGLISVLESSFLGRWLKKLPVFLQRVYALLLILIGWVFFKIEDVANWGPFFKALVGAGQPSGLNTARTLNILMYFPLLLLGIIASTPLFKEIYDRMRKNKVTSLVLDALLVGVFLLCTAVTVSGSYQAFLYSEF